MSAIRASSTSRFFAARRFRYSEPEGFFAAPFEWGAAGAREAVFGAAVARAIDHSPPRARAGFLRIEAGKSPNGLS
ncbi:MAG TPA: hypothetical protein VFJ25_04590 [Casimicrobiaceae bacterium]|nr:hypothetical protein [Casimicrobiaceae bacterium]